MEKKPLERTTSIAFLSLRDRTRMALESAGLNTVGAVADLDGENLQSIPNIGMKLAWEILAELSKYDIADDKRVGNDRVEELERDVRGLAGDNKNTGSSLRKLFASCDGLAGRITSHEKATQSTKDMLTRAIGNLSCRLEKLESATNELTGRATLDDTREMLRRADDNPPLAKEVADLLFVPATASQLVLSREQRQRLKFHFENEQGIVAWHENHSSKLAARLAEMEARATAAESKLGVIARALK